MKIILMNDVETKYDTLGMIVGGRDASPTEKGLRDSVLFAQHVLRIYNYVDYILSSPMIRSSRILHLLRSGAKHKVNVQTTPDLRERSLGVFDCNTLKSIGGFQSDIFQHARICAEKGESIAQCLSRLSSSIKHHLTKNMSSVIILSHSLSCNIVFNSFLGMDVTKVHPFWLKKTSYAVLNQDEKELWFTFETSHNVIENKQYSLQEIEDEFNEICNISSSS